MRVCITGGPKSHKSFCINKVYLYLREKLNKEAFLVPQASSIISLGGVDLKIEGKNPKEIIEYQKLVIKLQMNLEDIYTTIAFNEQKNIIILCEEGTLDGLDTLNEIQLKRVLEDLKITISDLRDIRYDIVVFLITCADGAESQIEEQIPNDNRKNYLDDLIVKDRNLQNLWTGHRHLIIIANRGNSKEDKISKACNNIFACLNLPNYKKTKYKYLIEDPGINNKTFIESNTNIHFENHEIEVTFLKSFSSQIKEKLVMKFINGSYLYTYVRNSIHTNKTLKRKIQISFRDYIKLLERRNERIEPLIKIRSCFLYESCYFIIDVYKGLKEVVSIMKIQVDQYIRENEIDRMKESAQIPNFIKVLKNISDNSSYSDERIIESGFTTKEEVVIEKNILREIK